MTGTVDARERMAAFWHRGHATALESQASVYHALDPSVLRLVCSFEDPGRGTAICAPDFSVYGTGSIGARFVYTLVDAVPSPIYPGRTSFPHAAPQVDARTWFMTAGSVITGFGSAIFDPAPPDAARPELPETVALDRLQRRTGISYAELSEITGVGRTTLFSWRNENVRPRAATTRLFWRVVALVDALGRQLSNEELRGWLRAGSPSPLDLLSDGRVEKAERLAQRIISQNDEVRPKYSALGFENREIVVSTDDPRTARRSNRKATKGRRLSK
jgi:hypothetical protein